MRSPCVVKLKLSGDHDDFEIQVVQNSSARLPLFRSPVSGSNNARPDFPTRVAERFLKFSPAYRLQAKHTAKPEIPKIASPPTTPLPSNLPVNSEASFAFDALLFNLH